MGNTTCPYDWQVQNSDIVFHLETNVHIGTVDGRAPPEREPPVGDLVETRPLRIGQLLIPVHKQVVSC